MRPHVAAVYAFARVADDIADEGQDPPAQRQARLRAWQRSAARRRRMSVSKCSGAAGPLDS